METLLNLFWLLLAVAAFLVWWRQDARKRRGSLGLVGLFCVLALMFPVISATDDLHSVAQAVEDASKRIQKRSIALKSHITHAKHGSVYEAVSSKPPVFQLTFECFLQPASEPTSQPGFKLEFFGRPPPLLTS